jgi:hypothetical protein
MTVSKEIYTLARGPRPVKPIGKSGTAKGLGRISNPLTKIKL